MPDTGDKRIKLDIEDHLAIITIVSAARRRERRIRVNARSASTGGEPVINMAPWWAERALIYIGRTERSGPYRGLSCP